MTTKFNIGDMVTCISKDGIYGGYEEMAIKLNAVKWKIGYDVIKIGTKGIVKAYNEHPDGYGMIYLIDFGPVEVLFAESALQIIECNNYTFRKHNGFYR